MKNFFNNSSHWCFEKNKIHFVAQLYNLLHEPFCFFVFSYKCRFIRLKFFINQFIDTFFIINISCVILKFTFFTALLGVCFTFLTGVCFFKPARFLGGDATKTDGGVAAFFDGIADFRA